MSFTSRRASRSPFGFPRRHHLGALVAAGTAGVVACTAAFVWSGAPVAEAADGDPTNEGPAPVSAVLVPASAAVVSHVGVAASWTAELVGAVPEPPVAPEQECPVPAAEFVDSWGFPRSGGRRHKGVDMMAPYGSPVRAPASGAIRTSNSRLGGLGFWLEGDDGTTYFGSHLATYDVDGSRVEVGELIGTVGTSGNANSPHLHFEIMLADRGSVNPFLAAAAWCGIFDDHAVAPT